MVIKVQLNAQNEVIYFPQSSSGGVDLNSASDVIELVAFGKHARKLARFIVSLLNSEKTYYICSNNEYCLDELFKIRKSLHVTNEWKLGITGKFPPIPRKYDFVYLERSLDCPTIRSMIKCPIVSVT